MKMNKQEELEQEKLALEVSINLKMAMVYDNRFDTSSALDLSNKEDYKTIIDAYTHNEEYLKNEVFNQMCRIYKIDTQLEFLRNPSLGVD